MVSQLVPTYMRLKQKTITMFSKTSPNFCRMNIVSKSCFVFFLMISGCRIGHSFQIIGLLFFLVSSFRILGIVSKSVVFFCFLALCFQHMFLLNQRAPTYIVSDYICSRS